MSFLKKGCFAVGERRFFVGNPTLRKRWGQKCRLGVRQVCFASIRKGLVGSRQLSPLTLHYVAKVIPETSTILVDRSAIAPGLRSSIQYFKIYYLI
jgi:hypothetical protein